MRFIFILLLILQSINMSAQFGYASTGYELSYTWVSDSTYTFKYREISPCTNFNGIAYYDDIGSNFTANLMRANNCVTSSFQNGHPPLTLPSTLPNGLPNKSEVLLPCNHATTTCDTNLPNNLRSFKDNYFVGNATLDYACPQWRFAIKPYSNQIRRDSLITNIAKNYHWYIGAEINFTNATYHNSSATLQNYFPVYAPLGQEVNFSLQANDPDGDSLVYQITHTKQQLYSYLSATYPVADIPFLAPYSLAEPFATNGTWQWDSTTAVMRFTATTAQSPLITLRIDEYRNGIWMGASTRDIPIELGSFPIVLPQKNNLLNSYYNVFSNGEDSINAFSNTNGAFCVALKSANSLAKLKVYSDINTVLPSLIPVVQNQYTDSATICFTGTPTINQLGWHTFKIWVKDTTCATNTWQTYAYKILITTPNSVSNSVSKENVKIYPNPATNQLFIDSKEAQNFTIFSSIGEAVYQTTQKEKSSSIDISNFSKGIYFIRINNETISFIKQ